MTAKKPTSTPAPELISLAELGRRKGVSRQAVSLAAGDGGPLHGARRGRRLDANDPAVIGWLTEAVRGPDSTTPEGDAPSGAAVVAPTRAEMLALSKRKREAEALRLELANEITMGLVVTREYVRQHVLSLIDGTHRRLLTDVSQTIALQLQGHYRSGGELAEARIMVSEQISRAIKFSKAEAQRKLAHSFPEHEEIIMRTARDAQRSATRRARKSRGRR